MRRLAIGKQAQLLSEELFGGHMKSVNMKALSEATGLSRSTLYRYKEAPECIPYGALVLIRRAVGMDESKLVEFMK